MAPIYIFAEQVWDIVRAGQKEMEIPEGARISAAAADLIKEHQLQIKTIAPSQKASANPAVRHTAPMASAGKSEPKRQAELTDAKLVQPRPSENPVGITEEDLAKIVSRVVERFNQLKGGRHAKEKPARADTGVTRQDTPVDVDELDDLVICRCEEITLGEIKDAIRNGFKTLNGIKRVTRAGMGLCQGQTCQRLVTRIITEELGIAAADIEPTTARGPVRPLPLAVFANS